MTVGAVGSSWLRLGGLVDLVRGTTYKSRLLDLPGPVLLGLSTLLRDGGFRRDSLRTYGGESSPKLLVEPGDLYVSLKDVTQSGDLLGAVARVPRDIGVGRLTQDTVRLIPKARLDVPCAYIYWVLRSPEYRDYCRERGIGTTNLSLSRDDFLAFSFPPVTPKRLRVVALLEAIEQKIELCRRTSTTLEALASTLFKSWFVDFDPVQAKRDGRTPRLPVAALPLLPDRFEDTSFGPVPRGWEVIKLADCGTWVSGGTPSKQNPRYWGGDVPWISARSLHSLFLEHSENRLTPEGVVNGSRLVPRGSVLFLVRGMSLAEEFRFGIAARELAFNQDTKAIIPRADIDGILIASLLRHETDTVLGLVDEASHGTKRLQTELVEKLTIVLPPMPLRKLLSDPLGVLASKQLANQRQCQTLCRLRGSLLRVLLSGDVSVENAGHAAQEVA